MGLQHEGTCFDVGTPMSDTKKGSKELLRIIVETRSAGDAGSNPVKSTTF